MVGLILSLSCLMRMCTTTDRSVEDAKSDEGQN